MIKNISLDKIYQYLLITIAFLMPLSVSIANTAIVIIVFLWLLSGDYKSKYNQIINSKLLIASIVFFGLHVISLLWSEDLIWGLHIVHKMWYFLLLLPVLYTTTKREYVNHYIYAFLFAIAISEICSYLVWLEIVPEFRHATVSNPVVFMSHISYNPILAFAIYLVSHEVFFNKDLSRFKFNLYSFFAMTMTINMFITGGRAGQVMYFAMLSILIFQFFNAKKIRALLIISLLIPLIFIGAYQTSSMFQYRVDGAIKNIIAYPNISQTSIGLRLSYAINSWEIIKENPLIGVGVGDFPIEYSKVNQRNTPEIPYSTNPHNMYTLVLVQLGLVGLASMLYILYCQIKLSFYSENRFLRDVGITMPILFSVIMLSDSYLLGHFTGLLFVFFSSFLYKDFDKS